MLDFSRRINGITYYTAVVCSFLIGVCAAGLGSIPKTNPIVDTIIGLAIIGVALGLVVYWICIIRQRANDIGWHPLLVTAIGFWTPVFFILGLIPGQMSSNKFGHKPKAGIKLKP
jgi:uncharacterized membrane protein YhaH (DUF805 family)